MTEEELGKVKVFFKGIELGETIEEVNIKIKKSIKKRICDFIKQIFKKRIWKFKFKIVDSTAVYKLKAFIENKKLIQSGEPCGHPGCKNHISHPCEGCGRIGAKGEIVLEVQSD